MVFEHHLDMVEGSFPNCIANHFSYFILLHQNNFYTIYIIRNTPNSRCNISSISVLRCRATTAQDLELHLLLIHRALIFLMYQQKVKNYFILTKKENTKMTIEMILALGIFGFHDRFDHV